jgi:hypothetical protein
LTGKEEGFLRSGGDRDASLARLVPDGRSAFSDDEHNRRIRASVSTYDIRTCRPRTKKAPHKTHHHYPKRDSFPDRTFVFAGKREEEKREQKKGRA